jgi:iron complex outermembrane receptor protein
MRKILLTSAIVLACPPARAQDDVVTAPVEVHGTREGEPQAEGGERALEEPGFVTVVDVDRRRDETVSIAEALAETVGVSVRALGGLGAFASISMRGAPAGQTEILIDGVPLSRVAFSSIDVGSLELASFDRVEILRGGVPAELGGAVLGGAANFVTRTGPAPGGERTRLTVGGGSFGARRARIARGDAFGETRTALSAGYAGAEGDFDYFDDNGTPQNRADDRERRRANNGFDAVDVAARAAAAAFAGGGRFSWKGQGVPGPSGVDATRARLETTRAVADGGVRRGGALGLRARAHAVYERQRFTDPAAEIALTMADTSFTTGALGLAGGADWTVGTRQRLAALVDGRLELFERHDRLAEDPERRRATGRRIGAGASLADEIVLGDADQLVVVPALRADVLSTRGEGTASTVAGEQDVRARDDLYLSPRVSARWRLTPAVTAKLDLGRYFRPPTVVELFGDRGFVAGNPLLEPEVGVAGDLGVVAAPAERIGPVDRVYLEAALFAATVTDLIAFLPTAGRFARAGNLADAEIFGLETAFAARFFRAATLTGNYTFLESRQRSESVAIDGRRLPGRPRHELYLRLDLARRFGRVATGLFADLTLASGNFLDEGNLNEVPARRFLGAGVRVAPLAGLSLVVEVKNLLDHRVETVGPSGREVPRAVADVLDHPLPGRAVYFTADWSF